VFCEHHLRSRAGRAFEAYASQPVQSVASMGLRGRLDMPALSQNVDAAMPVPRPRFGNQYEAVPGIAEAVRDKTVVGVSPIIGGAPVRGMADACLAAIGVETSATAVAAHYGADLLDGWLVDDQDKAAAEDPSLAGITVRALPLYMTDQAASAEIARAALSLAVELR